MSRYTAVSRCKEVGSERTSAIRCWGGELVGFVVSGKEADGEGDDGGYCKGLIYFDHNSACPLHTLSRLH